MSKITNDGLTRSGTGCFIAVPMTTVGVKGLSKIEFDTTYRIVTVYCKVVVAGAPVFRARTSGSVCKGDVVRRGTHQLVVVLRCYGERWTFDGSVINCIRPCVRWWPMTFPGTSYHRASRHRRTAAGTRYLHVLWTVWKHTVGHFNF